MQEKSVLVLNTQLEVSTVEQLKQLIQHPCKVYKIVPVAKGDIYKISPATQLTCSNIQFTNRLAKQISEDLEKSLTLYKQAVVEFKNLKNLMEHKTASINISKQVCNQLETYAETQWAKLAPGTRQKVQSDSAHLHTDKIAERIRKENLMKTLQNQEQEVVQSLQKELEQISDCFRSIQKLD